MDLVTHEDLVKKLSKNLINYIYKIVNLVYFFLKKKLSYKMGYRRCLFTLRIFII